MGRLNSWVFCAALTFLLGCATPTPPPVKTRALEPVAPTGPVIEPGPVTAVQAGTPSQMSDEERAARISDILRLFDQMMPRLEACYQESDMSWGDNVKVQLRLDSSGNLVEQAWDIIPNESLRVCAEKVVQGQWFGTPAPTERLSLGFSFDAESGTVSRLKDAQMIAMVLRRNEKQIQSCFERSIKRSDWQGEVNIHFTINAVGVAQFVQTISTADEEMKNCVTVIMEALDYGICGKSSVEIRKKFIFQVAPE